jgi:prepilin-type N-terminal cleavage/methylation domain-containing protein
MILQNRSVSVVRRRSAFTLLEVLVVVAIILTLASVATVATMSYLEDSKYDKTKLNLNAAEKAYQTAIMKNGGDADGIDATHIARYLSGGQQDLVSAVDNQTQFQFGMVDDPVTGQRRPQVSVQTPKGPMTSWDK